MPQVFRVLCCYNCEIFQVHFVKKSNKWQCKVCNEKQSLKKAFKIGTSSECRSLVQQLNMQRGCQKLMVAFKIGTSSECRSLVQQLNMQRGCQKLMVNAEEEAVDSTITEKRHVSNSNKVNEFENIDNFSEFDGCEDEFWTENDDDFTNDSSRFSSDILTELNWENPTSKNNSLTEEMKPFQTLEDKSQQEDAVNSLIKDVKEDKPIFSENIQNCDKRNKRFSESCSETLSAGSMPRPFKKNRGFEFIKYAASKLG